MVALIFLLVVFLIIMAVVLMGKKDPTCSDGIKNQGEFEIDCGGPCYPCQEKPVLKDLEVLSTEWVYDADNRYDLVLKIKNPNSLYGAQSFQYQVKIQDAANREMAKTDNATEFILPGETKYILIPAVGLTQEPAKLMVEIQNPKWEKFTDYEEPNLVINNKSFQVSSGGQAGFARASGTLINNSPYDFETILVKVLLRDSNGKLLAINHQTMNTVRAREQRDYNMVFSHSFPGSVQNIEVEPEVNVFLSDNYVRMKGAPIELEQEE